MIRIITSVLLLSFSCNRDPGKQAVMLKEADKDSTITNFYDQDLAKKLGADDYGMKNYIVCFLRPGKQKIMRLEEVNAIEEEHFRYMNEQVSREKLCLLGLFPGNRELYEQLVFDVQTQEEAETIMKDDPKVKEGLVVPEYHSWYGPAALKELKPLHDKITRIKIEPGHGNN